ncbi:hypothetical protein [Shimia sp.]|uniref:hypothetical protein n=1 Tax=Shimia sp. TaxID=1954381 RepID=UPI003BACB244
MTKKATSDLMDQLHALTAQSLADIIQNGIPVFSKETGEEVGREPAPASYIAAAIKFLKDNDITADPGADRFDPLEDALKDLPTLDDGDDNTYYN